MWEHKKRTNVAEYKYYISDSEDKPYLHSLTQN